MAEPIEIRFNPALIAAARRFNREVAAIDWGRIQGALGYALTHGGNLPQGFMDDRESPADAPSPAPDVTGGVGQ